MYFHVMVGARDLEESRKFYDATLAVLGVPAKGKLRDDPAALMYGDPTTGLFLVTLPMDGEPATHANGGTIMFKAASVEVADSWYRAGLANGGSDVFGPPAPGGLPNTVMSYLRDPTGNKLAVVAFV